MTFQDPFSHHGHYHPSVNAAIAAREKLSRIEAMREAEPEPDLREAVQELAEVLMNVTTTLVCQAATEALNNPNSAVAEVDLEQLNRAHDKAHALMERLS